MSTLMVLLEEKRQADAAAKAEEERRAEQARNKREQQLLTMLRMRLGMEPAATDLFGMRPELATIQDNVAVVVGEAGVEPGTVMQAALRLSKPVYEEETLKAHFWCDGTEWSWAERCRPGELQALALKAGTDLLDWLANERRKAEEDTQYHRQARERAKAIMAIAQEHMVLHAVYDDVCRAWVQKWAAKLWQPSMVFQVRYVAASAVPLTPELRQSSVELLYCRQRPAEILKALIQHGEAFVQTTDEADGTPGDISIFALVDAKPMPFMSHDANRPMICHRSIRVGDYWLNIPGGNTETPNEELPQAPEAWGDY